METTKKKVNKGLVAEALRVERANARRGCAKQKNRSEVSGGGGKPWRQKGTGRARQGSIRAVQWRGGGRAFGAALENYELKMNKKARRAALAGVLEDKAAAGRVIVDEFRFDAPSTKRFRGWLEGRQVTGKVLLIYESGEAMKNAVKSARNLPQIKCIHADRLNIADLLDSEWLLVPPAVAQKLNLKS